MTERTAGVLAGSALALTLLFALSTIVFGVIDDGTQVPTPDGTDVSALSSAAFALMVSVFAAIGALVASRRPGNRVGWILCVCPVFLSFTQVADALYVHAYYADPGSLPDLFALYWVANWAWAPGFFPLLSLLLLWFPDGRPPSPRWRAVGGLALLALAVIVLGYAFAPGQLEDYGRLENRWAAGDLFTTLKNLGFPLFALAAVASMVSLIVRFRRSLGVEHQQLKWMAAAAALVVLCWIANAVADAVLNANISFVLLASMLTIPVAAAIAVLRYRLYDLGLVIRRTLVYAVLSATLAGAYLACVLLLQLVLNPLTSGSSVAVALSTLAVAALVRPARSRIQQLVDRRFNRRRYDAEHTVAAFTAHLRDEVDLEAIGGELRRVVADTVQPAHVSLWLRGEGARGPSEAPSR